MFLNTVGIILIVAFWALIKFVINPKQSMGILSCGLTGFSGKNSFDIMKMKLLLYWNSIERGKDATGIFTPKTGVIKDNVEAKFYLTSERMAKIKADTLLIGHVRAKTIGVNTAANAHPFEYGDIIMAHNGTLSNHWSLAGTYDMAVKDFDVDSQIIANAINLNFQETPNGSNIKVLSQYDGAAALLFYNKDQDLMYAWHDKDRPLFYGYVGEDMYISSIEATLKVIECTDIKEFPINTLHAIKDGQIIGTQVYEKYVSISNKRKESVIMNLSQFGIATHNNIEYKTVPEGTTGIAAHVATPELVAGYWVECDSNIVAKPIVKGEWYFILNQQPTATYHLRVRDTEGNVYEVSKTYLNLRDFIPVRGSYVTTMNDLLLVENKKKVATKGQIFKVLTYTYGDSTIYLEEPFTGDRLNCNIKFVRNSTSDEIAILEGNLKMLEKANKDANQQVIDFDLIKTNSNTDVDVKDIAIESNKTYVVDFGAYCDTLLSISNIVDTMITKNECSEDINEELEQLSNLLITSYDVATIPLELDSIKC